MSRALSRLLVAFMCFTPSLCGEDPDYIKVLDLFEEQPLVDFSESLTQDEVKALQRAYADLEGRNMTDEQFAEAVGKYSRTAMRKMVDLQKKYDQMTANLDKNSQNALESMQDIGANNEVQPTAQDVCDWILKSSSKIRQLTANEKAEIVKDLPNLGRIMTRTNYLRVQNCADVNLLILDILAKFGGRD
ncbi:hypothetical protein QR680_013789 [Steinernema hermaphroditum]|uniref:SXP/RAL-2 family protein Ani s 5-like cation-binding domain-containing protein n=1 Tax=Steinernema hermaphroditum TaxID=289476 RepID=A0AA39M335_9BILA|nr:hypothetical protein QR680_013789 [Steinernema hermaphroditum]